MSEGLPATDVERLQVELAEVARKIARLLVQPEHDSADVLALDVRAGALRRRIAEVRPLWSAPDPIDLRTGGRLVSGG